MTPEYCGTFNLGGSWLLLEYSGGHGLSAPGGGRGGFAGDGGRGNSRGGGMDWLCDSCSTANFARWVVGQTRVEDTLLQIDERKG